MPNTAHAHLIEINEAERLLTIYRITNDNRQLFTSVKLPDKSWKSDPEEIRKFCQTLGENILLDSPQARKLLGI
jgi:hypothetical protein